VAEPNDDSILETTKKLVGIEPDNTDFDTEIVTHINSVFFTLQQLGVGPKLGFMIMGSEETWSQFILLEQIMAVKSYMGLKVKLPVLIRQLQDLLPPPWKVWQLKWNGGSRHTWKEYNGTKRRTAHR